MASRRVCFLSAVVAFVALASLTAGSALGIRRQALAPDHVSLTTHAIALPSTAKKKTPVCKKGQKSTKAKPCTKPVPVCKKGQKSTKAKPCKKRHLLLARARSNPPVTGWTFSLGLSSNPDGSWRLQLTLSRTAGHLNESHFYIFQLSPGSVTIAPDLSTVAIDTGSQLGQFGTVNLTFANPGALAQGTAPSGCTTGTWQTRSGTLTGTVSFVADGSYFKTIVEKSLAADLAANTSGTPASCGSVPPPCIHQSSLVTPGQGAPSLFVNSAQGSVSMFEFLSQTVGPATISHSLSETSLPASDLSVASDLSTATVATSGSSGFSGSQSFTAGAPANSGPYPACGSGATFSSRQGTTTGGITAHFLGIPPPGPVLGTSFAGIQ